MHIQAISRGEKCGIGFRKWNHDVTMAYSLMTEV